MNIIFDFDHTLLDTHRFKEAIVDKVAAFGPSAEEVRDAHERSMGRRDDRTGIYEPDRHIELLRESFPDDESMRKARLAIYDVLENTGDHLYPGAEDLLKRLKDRNFHLVLLTFGNEKWQKEKVDRSGISGYFDEVMTTAGPKGRILKETACGGDPVIVINDNLRETEDMMRSAPGLHYVVKRGLNEADVNPDVPVVDTFGELERFIMEKATAHKD